jgi:hypothetical protein
MHQFRHVEGKSRIVSAYERALFEMRAREFAYPFGEELLFGGEAEIHRDLLLRIGRDK